MNKFIDMFSISSFVFGIILYITGISLLDTIYFLSVLEILQYLLSKTEFIRKFWNRIEKNVSNKLNNKLNTRYNNNRNDIFQNLIDIIVGVFGWFLVCLVVSKKNRKKIYRIINV